MEPTRENRTLFDWREWGIPLLSEALLKHFSATQGYSQKLEETVRLVQNEAQKIWKIPPEQLPETLAKGKVSVSQLNSEQLVALARHPGCSNELLGDLIHYFAIDELRYLELEEVLTALKNSKPFRALPLIIALQKLPPLDARWLLKDILEGFEAAQVDAVVRGLGEQSPKLVSILQTDRPVHYLKQMFEEYLNSWEHRTGDCDFATPPPSQDNNLNVCISLLDSQAAHISELTAKGGDKKMRDKRRLMLKRFYRESNQKITQHFNQRNPTQLITQLNAEILQGKKEETAKISQWEGEGEGNKVKEIESLFHDAMRLFLSDPTEKGSPSLAQLEGEFARVKEAGGDNSDVLVRYYLHAIKNQFLPVGDFDYSFVGTRKIEIMQKEFSVKEIVDYLLDLRGRAARAMYQITGANHVDSTFATDIRGFIRQGVNDAAVLRAVLLESVNPSYSLLYCGGWSGQDAIFQECQEILKDHPGKYGEIDTLLKNLYTQYREWEGNNPYLTTQVAPLLPLSEEELPKFAANPISWLETLRERLKEHIDQVKARAALPFMPTAALTDKFRAEVAELAPNAFRAERLLLEKQLEVATEHLSHVRWGDMAGTVTTQLLEHAYRTDNATILATIKEGNLGWEALEEAVKLKINIEKRMAELLELCKPGQQVAQSQPVQTDQETFIDFITDGFSMELMNHPWKDENGHVLDLSTWLNPDLKGRNPYDRKPIKIAPAGAVQQQIDDYKTTDAGKEAAWPEYSDDLQESMDNLSALSGGKWVMLDPEKGWIVAEAPPTPPKKT